MRLTFSTEPMYGKKDVENLLARITEVYNITNAIRSVKSMSISSAKRILESYYEHEGDYKSLRDFELGRKAISKLEKAVNDKDEGRK